MKKEVLNPPSLMPDFPFLELFILLSSNTNLKIQINPSFWMKAQVMILTCHAQRQQNQALRCTRLSSPGVLGPMSGTTFEDGKDRWDMFNVGKSLKIMKRKAMIDLSPASSPARPP